MEVNVDIFKEVLKDNLKTIDEKDREWVTNLFDICCKEAYERTLQFEAYNRIHRMCTFCSYAKYNPETHAYECKKDFDNNCRIMYHTGSYFFDRKEKIDEYNVYFLFDNELFRTLIFIYKDGRCVKFMESLDRSYHRQHGEKKVNLDEAHNKMVKDYLEELKGE